MIVVTRHPAADTRTCDCTKVTKTQLLAASLSHIHDVQEALNSFRSYLLKAASCHDYDKITKIDHFHEDFATNFEQTGWWDNHRKIHRHHLNYEDGTPPDVNLLDVLEYIADCVMAGMARTGEVYPLVVSNELLMTAFQNTVEKLKAEVIVGPVTANREPSTEETLAHAIEALKSANDLCRSAMAITDREGAGTNWDAFKARLAESLVTQHAVLTRITEKDFKEE